MMRTLLLLLLVFNVFLSKTLSQTPNKLSDTGVFEMKARIAGKIGGEITKEELLNSSELALDCSLGHYLRITSYRMTIVSRGDSLKEYKCENQNQFTGAMVEALKKAPVKSKIYFEYIHVMDENKVGYSLPPISFILK